MSLEKRLRIFAGPNGSGKTTIINKLKEIRGVDFFGVYLNADDIESELKKSGQLGLQNLKIKLNTEGVQSYFKQSTFSPIKLNLPELWKCFSVDENCLAVTDDLKINSYIAADIANMLRERLSASGVSFSFETVMSDKKKLDFIKECKEKGYRIYLYFVATEDPIININRVNIRVNENGHNVSEEIIKNRYYKSLENLKSAVRLSNRAYIFDNSGLTNYPVVEITDGVNVEVYDTDKIPEWVIKYLLT